MTTPSSRLTARQVRFVEQYLVTLNATQACIEAGFSAKTAGAAGSRLLRNVKVAAAIRDAQQARAVRVGITQVRVLAELEELAFSSIDHYRVDDDGKVVLTPEAPPQAMCAVQSIKRRVQETGWDKDGHVLRTFDVEIKLWDKTSMLKLAAQHVGIGREQLKGADDLVDVTKLSDATLAAVIADLKGRVH